MKLQSPPAQTKVGKDDEPRNGHFLSLASCAASPVIGRLRPLNDAPQPFSHSRKPPELADQHIAQIAL